MKNSSTTPTGITYDQESAEGCLALGRDTCHIISDHVRLADLIRNHATRRMIQDRCVANRAERVPTPKVRVAEANVVEVLVAVSSATRHGNVAACGQVVSACQG
ncbi:U-box domain-containing protein 21 [Hordeum vulgare]|nr:U-box domain-containing protein 21 [Hordeum vulgare]